MKELYDFLGEIDALDETGRAEVAAVIERTTELKQLPLVARKVMLIIEDPRSTASDLERVLLSDQALTIKILKIANSSFYGLLRKVNTLQRAIMVVGFKAIKDIAVSTAILNMYHSSDPLSLKLWEAAVGCGIASRFLALEFDDSEVDEAFVAGLLHNLGKVVMLRAYPQEYRKLLEESLANPLLDDLALERQTFHYSHPHVSGALVKSWNLSPSLEATLRYYRYMRESQWADLDYPLQLTIAIVSYAHRLCHHLGLGYERAFEEIDILKCPEVEFLQLSEKRILELKQEISASFYEEGRLFA